MKKIIFLLVIFLIFLLTACTEDAKPTDVSGQLGEKCKAEAVCNAGLACIEDKCVDQANACEFKPCSNHGTCIVENSKPVCDCDDGYTREGDLKCVASDVCNGVLCSDKGTCVEKDGEATCNCDEGYIPIGTNCIESNDPCANIDCSGHGTCQIGNDGLLSCNCETDYHPQNLNCISDNAPCDGVTCSNHGTCEVDGTDASCNCDAGFIANGLECVDEATNPCKDVTCSNHGECQIHGDEATCICDANYLPGDNLTCVSTDEPDACEEVTCSGHGTCYVDSDDNPVCLCDEGYIKAGFMCIEDISSPCYEKTCSDHGECKVSNGEAYCDCDTDYFPQGVLACVAETEICNGITCSGHGTCYSNSDGSPTCDCDATYVAVGSECVLNPCQPNPCENIENGDFSDTCIAHEGGSFSCVCAIGYFWNDTTSTCDESTCPNDHMHPENGTCVCDEGYEADGEYCVLVGNACDSNPCAGYANTVCVLEENNVDGYICNCADGYDFDQFNNCVIAACASEPCLDNGDDNKNVCVANGDTYLCECNFGYEDVGGTCQLSSSSACDSNPCDGIANATGECEAGFTDDLYYCVCDDTYTWDGVDTCVSCDTCASLANATGNCEISFDGETQECYCDDGYTFGFVDDGNGNFNPVCEQIN